MYDETMLGLEEAGKAMQAMLDEALKEPDRPIAIAVVDSNGKLVQFARMDRCRSIPQQLAYKKAYTAAVMRSDTGPLAERFKSMGRSVSDFGDPNMIALQGGVVIQAVQRRGLSGRGRRERAGCPGGRGSGPKGHTGYGPLAAFVTAEGVGTVTQEAALFQGPAGTLEGYIHLPEEGRPCPGVAVCHPHPLMGGDMSNNVVTAICYDLARLGMASIRFNFRGVGNEPRRL